MTGILRPYSVLVPFVIGVMIHGPEDHTWVISLLTGKPRNCPIRSFLVNGRTVAQMGHSLTNTLHSNLVLIRSIVED